MAVHAIVVHTPAMVGCNVAAEVALILYIILFVLLAVCYSVLVVLVLIEELTLRAYEVIHVISSSIHE